MVVDLPELAELEINPLFADEAGVRVGAARMVLAAVSTSAADRRLAIRPYPQELEECVVLRDGSRALIRPIRPEDELAHRDLKDSMSPEDLRMRFFGSTGPITHAELARYTQIDYEREMAFVAVVERPEGGIKELGAVRLICDPDLQSGEFGINVRGDAKRLGLGRLLMDKVVRYAQARGLARVTGRVLAENTAMLGLCQRLGFTVEIGEGEDVAEVVLTVSPSP
jgi:acetyltransferase